MGLLGGIIAKGVTTAAKNATIRAVGDAAATVISSKANAEKAKEDISLKNGIVLIKPTRSSEDYIGKNALEMARELLGVGFESVTLKEVKKLNDRAKKKYGNIVSVSINGNKDFLGIKKIPASAYIVIEYLDFKDTTNLSNYESVTKIIPGTIYRDFRVNFSVNNNDFRGSKKYCSYCRKLIADNEAKFCSSCGKAI